MDEHEQKLLLQTLKEIAGSPKEENEWEAVEFYRECQIRAGRTLRHLGIGWEELSHSQFQPPERDE